MSKDKNADYRAAAQQLEVLLAELLSVQAAGGDTADVEENIAAQEAAMEKIRADRKAANRAAHDKAAHDKAAATAAAKKP